MATETKDASVQPAQGQNESPQASALPERSRAVVTRGQRIARTVERIGVPALLVVLLLSFSIALPDTFPTSRNLSGILSTEAIGLLLALGGMVPLICGEFDLSIGFILGFCSMEIAVLTINQGMNVWLAAGVTVLTALGIGLVNAFLVLVCRISSFIATLASGTVLSGMTLLIADNTIVTGVFPDNFIKLGNGGPADIAPNVFIALAVGVVLFYVLEHTPVGRRLEAVGQGREAARLSGTRVNRLVFYSLITSAVVAGLAGVLNTATQGSADPGVGPGFLLPALAAAFLGATTIRPGRFNVIGTILSVLLLAIGVNGLSQLGAPQWVPPVFNGGVLLLAVGVAQVRTRRI